MYVNLFGGRAVTIKNLHCAHFFYRRAPGALLPHTHTLCAHHFRLYQFISVPLRLRYAFALFAFVREKQLRDLHFTGTVAHTSDTPHTTTSCLLRPSYTRSALLRYLTCCCTATPLARLRTARYAPSASAPRAFCNTSLSPRRPRSALAASIRRQEGISNMRAFSRRLCASSKALVGGGQMVLLTARHFLDIVLSHMLRAHRQALEQDKTRAKEKPGSHLPRNICLHWRSLLVVAATTLFATPTGGIWRAYGDYAARHTHYHKNRAYTVRKGRQDHGGIRDIIQSVP